MIPYAETHLMTSSSRFSLFMLLTASCSVLLTFQMDGFKMPIVTHSRTSGHWVLAGSVSQVPLTDSASPWRASWVLPLLTRQHEVEWVGEEGKKKQATPVFFLFFVCHVLLALKLGHGWLAGAMPTLLA